MTKPREAEEGAEVGVDQGVGGGGCRGDAFAACEAAAVEKDKDWQGPWGRARGLGGGWGRGVDVGFLVGCGPYEWVSQAMAAMKALWAWRSGVKNLNVGMRIS